MTSKRYSPITKDDGWFIGEHKVFQFTIYQEDEVTVEDISTFHMKWEMRIDEREPVTLLAKTSAVDGGVNITDGPQGQVQVVISASDTTDFDPGTFAHALMRTDTDEETVLSYGPAVLQLAATR